MKKRQEIVADKSNSCTVHPLDVSSNKECKELFQCSESLLLFILENSPDPIFVKDVHHRWVFINQKFCELLGLPEEEILGKSDYDFFPKEQADEFWKTDELVFSGGLIIENTEFLTDFSGKTRTIATKKTLLIDEKGHKLLVGTIHDITELSLLRQRELQVNKVLKKLALGGSLEEVLSMILEAAEEEFPGMIASILIVDRDEKRLRSIVKPNLPDYFIRAIEGTPVKDGMGSCGTAAFRGETIVVEDIQTHPYWKGVRVLTVRANLSSCWSQPVFATDGEIVGTFALYYRESKRPSPIELKLMETMAQVAAISIESYRIKSEKVMLRKMLANIIDSMPSMLIGTDTKGKVTLWNLEAENLTGIPRDKALGQPVEVVYPKMKTEMSELYEAIRSKKVKVKMNKIPVQSEEVRYENITIYPLHANGIEGAVIRVDDVTEREQLEEIRIQNDKLKSIGVLAGGIAHDFNNLLVGIQGNIDLACNLLETSNKAYPLLQKAEKASLRAKDLTSQLLTFSKGGDPVKQPAAYPEIIFFFCHNVSSSRQLPGLLGEEVSANNPK
jgi:PAS domain S-box-containing protein